VVALEKVVGFEIFIVSAPPPFARGDAEGLIADAADVIARHFPQAAALYARRAGGCRNTSAYDPAKAERLLGFRASTDFAAVLEALRSGARLPFAHDPDYVSPSTRL
jgi:nucleoside-diphosphate-sugar epimerase